MTSATKDLKFFYLSSLNLNGNNQMWLVDIALYVAVTYKPKSDFEFPHPVHTEKESLIMKNLVFKHGKSAYGTSSPF